jgi:hypothetical protein
MIEDDESDRLMDLGSTWLLRSWVIGFAVLVLILVVGMALGAPARSLPLPVIGILVGFFLVATFAPAAIGSRYILKAARVRARVNADTPGLSGLVVRHSVALGLAVALLVGVVVVALRRI